MEEESPNGILKTIADGALMAFFQRCGLHKLGAFSIVGELVERIRSSKSLNPNTALTFVPRLKDCLGAFQRVHIW